MSLIPFLALRSTLLARSPFKSTDQCEPYNPVGTLVADSSDPDRNQWTAEPKCPPPGFLAQLRADSTTRATTDFSWLYNRTALIIGDSISREHVENFCNLMGEESEVVRPSHKYSPTSSPIRGAAKGSHALEKPARLSSRGHRVVRDAALPRICYIPQYDFLVSPASSLRLAKCQVLTFFSPQLASVFHFGLDQEDYWRESRMPQYQAPGMFEHRLSDVIQPLIANFRRDGRKSAPDYVEVTSGTWDLARWAEQDVESDKNTETGLTQDRVTWYRFRVGQMLEKIRTAFPNASTKTWRTLHYPSDQAAEHDYFMVRSSLLLTQLSLIFRAGQNRSSFSIASGRASTASIRAQQDLSTRSSGPNSHHPHHDRRDRFARSAFRFPNQRMGTDSQGTRGASEGSSARTGFAWIVYLGRQSVFSSFCSAV